MIGEGSYTEIEEALEDLLTLSGAFPVGDDQVRLQVSHYQNGRIAIEGILAKDSRTREGRITGYAGERYSVLTVNIPEEQLEPSEMFVKSWGHNEDFYTAVLEHFASVFEDTGKSLSINHVVANVWKIKPYDGWQKFEGEGGEDDDE